MPDTWLDWSKQIYGYVPRQTKEKERYVVTKIIESWVDQGLSNDRIFLKYNAGGAKQCSSGRNKHGVDFDSCAYVQKGLAQLAMR